MKIHLDMHVIKKMIIYKNINYYMNKCKFNKNYNQNCRINQTELIK